MYDAIIIGAGPGGLTAAIYAARYKMNTLVIASGMGTLADAHMVENWPGEIKISGIDLMKKMKEHVKYFNVPIKEEEVTRAEKIKNGFKVDTKKSSYEGKTIIIAIGTKRRKLNLPNEEKYLGKGITYCYTCDAPLMHDKVTAVVGGADSAAMAALLLTEYAKKVYILYRKEALRAQPILVEQVKKSDKIEVLYKTEVKKLKGSKFLESVILNHGKKLKIDFLFVEIGFVPSLALVKDLKLKTDKDGYVIVNKLKETNVKGVFAIGDITDTVLRQAITASGDGATAAFSAYKYCRNC
ncbi:MAG: FAD-dependent oxidoreductase [Nanoarchaeota archaeon]|nr:FAD-dependent oxidoreductase [Nanoarchaeota archaeon]